MSSNNVHSFLTSEDIDIVAPIVLESIANNGIIAYPTETVYGLGGGIDSLSLDNLTAYKGRDADKRYLLVISNPEMLKQLHVEIPMEAEILVKAFWPSALTIVFKVQESKRHLIDSRLLGENGGIAVRQTGHKLLRKLIDRIGGPITSTSANSSGQVSARSIDEIQTLPKLDTRGNPVHLLDGGTLPPSKSSTIVDCSGPNPVLIREGAVALESIKRVIPL